MSLILSLDTSSSGCSVAVHHDGKLLAISDIFKEHSHGARLALMINQVLDNAGVHTSELSAIAVASGPGSYTGLRIGTSTAKGLCYALNVPLTAVDSLSALTAQALKATGDEAALFCPMLDARRMEVYCCIQDRNLSFVEPIQAKILDSESFSVVLAGQTVLFFGDGSQKSREVISHPNARFLEAIHTSASGVGELAWKKYQQKVFEDLVHFEPYYLKEFLIKKSAKLDSLLNK